MFEVECLVSGGKVVRLDTLEVHVRRVVSRGGGEDEPGEVPPHLPLVHGQQLQSELRAPDPELGDPARCSLVLFL